MHQPARLRPLSTVSLPLQILVHYHYYLAIFYYIVTILGMIYKDALYPYPGYVKGWEASGLSFVMIMDFTRLWLASKGNKLYRVKYLVMFIIFSAPTLVGYFFFILWQTYVLRMDELIGTLAIMMTFAEAVLAVFAILVFSQEELSNSRAHLHSN